MTSERTRIGGERGVETYRGNVSAWEVDTVGHFTVAYYFDRFEHATLGMLDALGLGAPYMARAGRGCVTVDCYVRYLRELRAGDVLHVTSGVLDVGDDAIRIGHQLFDSAAGALCATLEQTTRHVELASWKPIALSAAQRGAAEARRIEWDGPARERRPQPRGVEGFIECGRDCVQPWEIDVFGHASMEHHIHRFSAGASHVLTAFGMTPAYQRDIHRGLSTFEFQLAFLRPLRVGDAVLVKTGLLHVGTSSLRLVHAMLDARSGETIATLDRLGVHLDLDARRPAPLPDALRAAARALLAPTTP